MDFFSRMKISVIVFFQAATYYFCIRLQIQLFINPTYRGSTKVDLTAIIYFLLKHKFKFGVPENWGDGVQVIESTFPKQAVRFSRHLMLFFINIR